MNEIKPYFDKETILKITPICKTIIIPFISDDIIKYLENLKQFEKASRKIIVEISNGK